MWRLILAIVLAPVFWGVLQLPGNLLLSNLFPGAAETGPAPTAYLLLTLGFSFLYGLFAGYCSAWVAAAEARKAGIGAGIILLMIGIAVQASFWDQLPLWWHLCFLAAIVPMAMLGARLKNPAPMPP